MVVLCIFSLTTVDGSQLFTASGTHYYHHFNISLCGTGKNFPLVQCHDNISFGLDVSTRKMKLSSLKLVHLFKMYPATRVHGTVATKGNINKSLGPEQERLQTKTETNFK